MPETAGPRRVERAVESLAGNTSRRGFLARVGAALTAVTAGGVVAKAVKPGEADAFHFCGHIFTTGSCPHPLGRALPRIDARGYPLRPSDGHPIDNIGRPVPSPIARDRIASPPGPRSRHASQSSESARASAPGASNRGGPEQTILSVKR